MDCGTDIIEILRIKETIQSCGDSFLNKVFTDNEINYCESHKTVKYQHYAVRFAAKEAVAKLLGTGFNGSFDWKEIEITNNDLGKPEVLLTGNALKLFNELGYEEIKISMSHCKEYATSIVIGC